jgi:hypothetical protein
VVARICAGADCIDDIDVVHSGGMKALFDGVYAPSTIRKLLREFTFRYARQLESVLSAAAMCLRQAGPEVPVLAAASCRFGCAAVGFDAGDIVQGELLPGSEHLVGEGDRGSLPRAAWPCAPIMPSNLGRSRTETCAVFRNSCRVLRRIRGQ